MRINTNIASMTAQEAVLNTNNALTGSLEKLGSGLRINKAADDASGLSIADKLRTQASSLTAGLSNANSASALIQIADKAMGEQSNILDTVKSKLIQAGTTTTNDEGREAIRKDINKLLTQFDNIASQTNYNGKTLLQKSATDSSKQDDLSFQLGEDASFDVTMKQGKASNTDSLGGGSDYIGTGDYDNVGVSITNTERTSANSLNGAQQAGGLVTDNNIGTGGSQQITSSGRVLLSDVDVSTVGTEAKAASSNAMDFDISGQIGEVSAGGDLTLDFSNETQAVKDAMLAIAGASTNFALTAGTETAVIKGGKVIDFGNLEFTKLNMTSASVGDAITLNADTATTDTERTFTISNNIAENREVAGALKDELLGQINIQNETHFELKGGQLLGDLKSLGANELTAQKANDFMKTIDESISQLNSNRSDFGSTQNQLDSNMRNMNTTITNLKSAESVIRDVNYAEESAEFNKQNIIAQAGTYAMSQSNQIQQAVTKLLQ